MIQRLEVFSLSVLTFVLIFGVQAHPKVAEGNARAERVRLTDEEAVIYRYLMERIVQAGVTPTKEAVEMALSRPIGDDVRAKISAKLYYESGIIGALLTDEESLSIAYLMAHRRRLGSLVELADRVGRFSNGSISPVRILKSLEFLYAAGYIDVRNGGEKVYFVLPQGVKTLYFASHVEGFVPSGESFQKAMAELSGLGSRGRSVVPVLIEEPSILSSGQGEQSTATELDSTQPPKVEPPQPSPEERGSETQTIPQPAISEPLEREAWPSPEPVVTVMSREPLGPPAISARPGQQREPYKGFPTQVMRDREQKVLPCAPDFWGWPYLYGQDDIDILAFTADTGSEVRITVTDGKLICCQPPNVIVLNEGQHGDIRFFRSEQNLRLWRQNHPDVQGEVMTLPQALSWARRILRAK